MTVPLEYIAENTVQSGGGHEGGQNFKPISFTNETTRVGCTTSLASNATVTIRSVQSEPLKAAFVKLTPVPSNAEPDDEFGFSETITEYPDTL